MVCDCKSSHWTLISRLTMHIWTDVLLFSWYCASKCRQSLVFTRQNTEMLLHQHRTRVLLLFFMMILWTPEARRSKTTLLKRTEQATYKSCNDWFVSHFLKNFTGLPSAAPKINNWGFQICHLCHVTEKQAFLNEARQQMGLFLLKSGS